MGRLPVALGSKSEHPALGIATDEGEFVVAHVAGDTPFAEETLTALEGRRVVAAGVWRNGTLRVAKGDVSSLTSAVRADEPPESVESPESAESVEAEWPLPTTSSTSDSNREKP